MTRTHWSLLTLAGMLVFAGACDDLGEPDDALAWSTTIDTLASGAARATNTPPADGPQATHTLVEELRIGTVDGGGPASFAQIKGLAVTDDGDVVVLDGTAQEIRVFAPDGTHRVTHGRQGQGPGEFASANGLMLAPDGTLVVPDHGNTRVNRVHPVDGFLGSEPMTVLSYGWVWTGAMLADGRFVEPTITLGPPRRNILKVYDTSLLAVDSIDRPVGPETDREDPPTSMYYEGPGGMSGGYIGIPHAESGAMLIHAEGTIWRAPALSGSHRLVQTTFEGDTLRVVETARPPRPLPTSVRDSVIAAMQSAIRERNGDIKGQSWDKVPTRLPFVTRIVTAGNGDLWVETGTLEGTEWDVFDPEGRWRRTVRTDWSLLSWVAPVIRGDTVWAVVTDDMDVQWVVRGAVTPRTPP